MQFKILWFTIGEGIKPIKPIRPIEPYVERQDREQSPVDDLTTLTIDDSTDSSFYDSAEYDSPYSLQNSGSHT